MNKDDAVIGPLPPEGVNALRARQQPPDGERYWQTLHAGIMSRITDADASWWTVLNRWSRLGLVAAGIVMVIATAAVLSMRTPEREVAFDEVLDGQPSVPVQFASTSAPARDETLRYVMSY